MVDSNNDNVCYPDEQEPTVPGDPVVGANHLTDGLELLIKESVTFTIDDTTYHGIAGETFADWVNSRYNTDGFRINSENKVEHPYGIKIYKTTGDPPQITDPVLATDTIVARAIYLSM